MYATYQIKADELNLDFLQSIKDAFKGKEIEISIMDFDETEYLLRSPRNKEMLLKRIKDVEEGKNLKKISLDELNQIL